MRDYETPSQEPDNTLILRKKPTTVRVPQVGQTAVTGLWDVMGYHGTIWASMENTNKISQKECPNDGLTGQTQGFD
jgi:hypothetical protein